MTAPPDRIAWAIEQLDPFPDDVILEIGCGRGVAALEICNRLKSGRYIGVDRSKTAINAAHARCGDHIRSRKARFVPAPLAEADFGKGRFDCALAINVNAFWLDGEAEVVAVRTALKPKGRLLLVYEQPSPSTAASTIAILRTALKTGGFARIRDVSTTRAGKLQLGVFASA